MDICANNHDEICYLGRKCPLCSALAEIDDLEQRIREEQEKFEEEK